MTDDSTPHPLTRVLRILILAELTLLVLIVLAAFIEDPLLPPLLQQYRTTAGEARFNINDWISIAFGIPALVLSILAWIGLWHGWRSGRRFYTIAWLLVVPSIAFANPTVESGPLDCLDTMLSMVGGAILSLLYFSDLRARYVK